MSPASEFPQPTNPGESASGLFGNVTPPSAPRSVLPWIVAAALVVLLLLVLLITGKHHAPASNSILPPDPYAVNLVFTDLLPSESTSLSGGKSTFVDGHVRNTGTRTLTAATLQVLFLNDEANPPQVETVPLTLIRTREPYIDTQLLNLAPLGPGEDREFRLIFENITTNWNQQPPQIHLVSAKLK